MKKIYINIFFKKEAEELKINGMNDVTIDCVLIDDNMYITNIIDNIKDLIAIYDMINVFEITFENNVSINKVNMVLSKLSNILYAYYPNNNDIIINNVQDESRRFMDELKKYKDIVMHPNKNPDTYLEYVLSRVPSNFKADVYKIKKESHYKQTKMFSLTNGVGAGSAYDTYFVHIFPKKINNMNKDVYMIGKSVTYDSGGLNLKGHGMEAMKVDMTGSAIILSVLNLINDNINDNINNIHLLIPIVENMIGNMAIRPGMTIKSMSGKMGEVVDTDAEGRLCLADAFDFVNMNLIKNNSNSIILDIATLTGNTMMITNGLSSIIMGNMLGKKYIDMIVDIGEEIGEYTDYIKLRPEYTEYLKTKVGDIANHNHMIKSGCMLGGAFISFFTNPDIPWIHLDVASNTFVDNMALSYGINLLYTFIKKI